MEVFGTAEAFYGEMYGNEARMDAKHLAVRFPDESLRIGRTENAWEPKSGPYPEPSYSLVAKPSDERYLVKLWRKQELTGPAVAVVYADAFLNFLTGSPHELRLQQELAEQPAIAAGGLYPTFRGFIATRSAFDELRIGLGEAAEERLAAYLERGDFSELETIEDTFGLWNGTMQQRYGDPRRLVLITAYHILTRPDEAARTYRGVGVHMRGATLDEVTAVQEKIRALLGKSAPPALKGL
jgi:hypothetical protein